MNSWEELKQECLQCHACSLAETRTNVVFGVGTPQAEVVIVARPRARTRTSRASRSSAGRASSSTIWLAMIGLDRSRIYITNSVKCRPPQNRDPLNTEKEACSGYLRRQMELMQPKILVCLGRISAMEMIKPDFKITREHGQFFEKDGIQMMALYHPAALLRDRTKSRRRSRISSACRPKIREICDHTPLDF